MYPAPFQYLKPTSLEEAFRFILEYGEDLKILAGGQSMLPMLNLRLARPAYVMDITGISDLTEIRVEGERISIGALVRHQTVVTDEIIREKAPLLSEAAGLIGNIRVRHRGTIGGSLAHADPAAEMAACALALGAEIEVVGPDGLRLIPADQFFLGMMTTSLGADEIITRIHFPVAGPRSGASFKELVRRAGDFAIVGVGCHVSLEEDGQTISKAGIGLIGVAATAVQATAAEQALVGLAATAEVIEAAAQLAVNVIDPSDDLSASSEYRREITPVMVRRALQEAVDRAREQHVPDGR